MSRQFTWWRRFYGVVKLPKRYLFKGASELLQRIEFGEYEVDNLGREVYLEDLIYEAKVDAIKKESPWLKGETLDEALDYPRKQYNKRKSVMMSKHLENEHKLLRNICIALSDEFKLERDVINDIMEEFDGTTRELYFYVKTIALNRPYIADKQPRLILEQPRHVLKPKERKYIILWTKLIKKHNWREFLNWETIQKS